MQKEIYSPMAASAAWTVAPSWLRSSGIVVAGSLLLALCAHVSVPLWFTPVPLSLQPFGVLLLGLLLGPQMAVATVVAYLAEGAAGLPVFAPSPVNGIAHLGIAHLLGPTGGYLMAYPVAAVLISFLWRRTGRGFGMALVSAALGDLLILGSGAMWLAFGSHANASVALSAGMLAFLPGDALKVAAVAGIAAGWQRLRRAQQ
jgi:biotin transport system substrate-specific component